MTYKSILKHMVCVDGAEFRPMHTKKGLACKGTRHWGLIFECEGSHQGEGRGCWAATGLGGAPPMSDPPVTLLFELRPILVSLPNDRSF